MTTSTPHIVYIHGLNCTSKIFSHLRSQLPKHSSTLIDYESSQPLETSYLEALDQIPKHSPVIVIGHSLGGIIGHLLATRNPTLPIEHLITISSPFGGCRSASALALFYPSFSVLKDITPSALMIKEAGYQAKTCWHTAFISTRGSVPFIPEPNDGVVAVRSQRAVPAHRVIDLSANHFESVQDPVIVREVTSIVF